VYGLEAFGQDTQVDKGGGRKKVTRTRIDKKGKRGNRNKNDKRDVYNFGLNRLNASTRKSRGIGTKTCNNRRRGKNRGKPRCLRPEKKIISWGPVRVFVCPRGGKKTSNTKKQVGSEKDGGEMKG